MIFDITRLTDVAGQDFTNPKCRVRSPHITARDSIEIGNYIVAKQSRIAELEKTCKSRSDTIIEYSNKIAKLESQMAEMVIEAEEVAGQTIKAFNRDDKQIAELEKELTETKNIIVAHQTADADGYIDDYGWVANWHEMEEGMIILFEAHKLEQQAKGLDNLHKEIEDGGSSSLMTFILKEEADSLRHQAKALKEQG